MGKIESVRIKGKSYLLDHPRQKFVYDYLWAFLVTAVSALFFAYGFRAFLAPSGAEHMVSGGASGITQVIIKAYERLAGEVSPEMFTTLDSIIYFVINIPLFILSWFKIGRRFTVTTFVNVLCVSLFIKILPNEWVTIFSIADDNVARALFAGLTTGISSSLAFLIGSSAGGIDVVSLYIAERKSTSIGKYSLTLNALIVISYVLLSLGLPTFNEVVTMALFTLIYFFTSSKVIDVMNQKNRKTQLQIITASPDMAQILIHTLPHGCTVVDARGAYTGQPKSIIYIVVSYSEVNKAVKIMRQVDPACFVTIVNTYQVYGKFYIKPIK